MFHDVFFNIRAVDENWTWQNNEIIGHTNGMKSHGGNTISMSNNENTNYGWYKSKDFNEPTKYGNLKI